MRQPNPWESYRQTATLTAPPGQIVLMLYDGVLRFLERALSGFDLIEPAERNSTINHNLQRAQSIVRELNCALDLEKGGQVAETLRRLYDYFDRRLLESNVKKTRDGIYEVIRHLTELRDAWRSMLANNDPGLLPLDAQVPAFATACA
jgi:flagellar secretion chaperone FliS